MQNETRFKEIRARSRFLYFIFTFIFIVFGLRVIILISNPEFEGSISVGRVLIYPKRGNIYDRNGNILASSEPVYDLYLDVDFLKELSSDVDFEKRLKNIANYFNIEYENLRKLIDSGEKFIRLAYGVTEDFVNSLPDDFREISVNKRYRRVYPVSELVGQIVGKVLEDGSAVSGVEKYMDNILKPRENGYIEYDRRGPYRTYGKIIKKKDPRNGDELYLSLDLNIQKLIKQKIDEAVKREKAKGGICIVMDTETGEIRGLYTTYDWNKSIMGYFEPGSLMKPVVYSIAIQQKLAFEDDEFECDGKIKPVEDVSVVITDIEKHGLQDLKTAFSNSCNVATVKIAQRISEVIGNIGYHKLLKEFGFGDKTGIEYYGEIHGLLREPSKWSRIDFAEISIGQGIGVTPLQMIQAVNTIVNDGILVRPTFIKGKKTEKKRVISSETAKFVRELMRAVVERGTGKLANSDKVKIAGKTGTAQKAVNGVYSKEKYYSSFIGFFPYENPKYTMLVIIDEPGLERYYGGEVAAPVFKNIAEAIISPPKVENKSFEIYKWKLPDFTGLTLRDVLDALKLLKIDESKIEIKGNGRVVKQEPAPGTRIEDIDKVVIYLSD